MKAIHNNKLQPQQYNKVVVNIIKSKNESNSQQEGKEVHLDVSCCKYH
ncbi:Uncharacterised protein [Sphingobacterium spiritivorum]|uniref:Uncharacterized protein n=1 Tax=Sphingobacterium spiritivorum ATCC 33861 TaxID=525373 RepID=D7VKC6_SPHSI|nr:hypothetical protein HMPREF0766_11445 [Sphingobacterium spiritivorum ATCC 33861]SUI99728.1 Uncharacterised protein [Sphingobacterium spiritivorum]